MKKIKAFQLLLPVFLVMFFFSCEQQPGKDDKVDSSDATVMQEQLKESDKNLLIGNWIRTDADYKIQISEIDHEGKMKTGYYNPASINVAYSNVKRNGELL